MSESSEPCRWNKNLNVTLLNKKEMEGQRSAEWQNSSIFCAEGLGSGNQSSPTELHRKHQTIPF